MKSLFIIGALAFCMSTGAFAQPSGNYITMNGGDDNVYIPASSYWNLSGDFTISMKLKFTTTAVWQMLMTHSPGGFELSYRYGQLWLSPTGFGLVFYADWNAQPNTWYHLVVTRIGSTISAYVDGQLIGNGGGSIGVASSSPLRLGNYYVSGYSFYGSMDEVSVWTTGATQSYVNSVLAYPLSGNESGLAACWKLDESGAGAGIPVHNSALLTGSSLDGITQGTATTPYFTEAPSAAQNCLDFDGINDFMNLGNEPALNMDNEMTAEAWVFPEGSGSGGAGGSGGMIVNKEGEFEIARFDNGYIGWAFANSSPGWMWIQTSAYIPLNQWSHVAVVYGNNLVNTYLNGILLHSYPVSGAIGDVAPGYNDLYISGRQTILNGQIFDGKMDEIRIWNIARSEAQIREEMHRELLSPETEAGLVAYFTLNQAGGNVAYDHSPYQYNGSLTNMDPSTDWETSTAPIPYSTIADGSWQSNATWNTGQNTPVNEWARVEVDNVVSSGADIRVTDLKITEEGELIINPAWKLSVMGDLVNENGPEGLVLKSGPAGMATVIENDGAAATVDCYFTGNLIDWHLVSSPMENEKSGVFLDMYLQQFSETANQYSEIIPAGVTLVPGRGYAAYSTLNTANTATFSGDLNAGDFSIPVTNSGTAPYGWNLIGNPYASGIDWNQVIPTLSGISNTIYYLEASTGNWLTWNGTTGSGLQFIPPMQGFFVSASANSTLTLKQNYRTHKGWWVYYKDEVPELAVVSVKGNNLTDKAYIQFRNDATDGYDGQFDGFKIISDANPLLPQIYTYANDEKMAVNVLPLAGVVPMGFQSGTDGLFVVELEDLKDIATAILEDKKAGIFTDLTETNYCFYYSTADDPGRFNLHFSALAIENISGEDIGVYPHGKTLLVNSQDLPGGRLIVTDILGKEVFMGTVEPGTLNNYSLEVKPGIYLVCVTLGKTVTKQKVFIP